MRHKSATSGEPNSGTFKTSRTDTLKEREFQSSSRKNIGEVNSPIATEVKNDDFHAIHRHCT
jgi:hypothetical protein